MLLDSSIVPAIMTLVNPEDFYQERHQRICRAIYSLEAKNEAADTITVADELGRDLDRIGGVVYLSELLDSASTSAHTEHHAKIVLEKSQLRNITGACEDITASVQKGTDALEVLDLAEGRILGISRGGTFREPARIDAVVRGSIDSIDHRMQNKGHITGVDTGFFELNRTLLGWQPDELAIVAARPSSGKTAFAVNCAMTAARSGVPTLFVSLEMTRFTLCERMLAYDSRLDGQQIRSGSLSDRELARIVETGQGVSKLPLWIDDDIGMNVYQVRAKARRLASRTRLGLLLVDYLQIIQSTKAAETWAMEIKKICEGLKSIGRELKIPVVVLAQLKRTGKGEEWRKPYLSDLKESGATEEVADTVILIHRPEAINEERAKKENLEGMAEIIVAKQRNGPTHSFRLDFDKPTMRFSDRSEQQGFIRDR